MNQKPLNVAMHPVENTGNQYIALTCSCIQQTGVQLYAFSSIFRSASLFFMTDLVIFNWFETLKVRRFQKITRFFYQTDASDPAENYRKKKLFLFFIIKSDMRRKTVFYQNSLCAVCAKKPIKSLFYLMHQNPLCAPI